MMTWAHYLLQVNIYLVIFYVFYKLLLDKETYFMMNRLYLIISGLLSLTIPFLRPEWFVKQPVTQQIKISVDQLNMMMAQVTVSPDEAAPFNWGQLAGGIYLFGLLFFLFRFIFQLAAVKKLIKNRPAGVAFTFFRKKVIDQNLPGLDTIYLHEEIHSRQLHTLDVLFFETLAVLVWCNPIVYLYKATVKNIHEYLADEEAARFQGDKESYAMLILSKAFGIDQNALTNSFFNKSLIKKRIFMLHKERSKKIAILKYGLFLPLFAATLLFSSATISRNEELKAVAEKITAPVIEIPGPPADGVNFLMPKNKTADSWTAFYKYLSKSIRYPLSAFENELQGNTMVKFKISNGEINGISVTTPLGLGCDAQVMKNILNFEDFKDVKDGNYCIKVAFRLADSNSPIRNPSVSTPAGCILLKEITVNSATNTGTGISNGHSITGISGNVSQVEVVMSAPHSIESNTSLQNGEGKVFDFVSIETAPSFPGGMDKFYKYLAGNVKFPAEAVKNNIQGKVFLSFIVEKTGELNDIQVVKSLGYGTDEEAVRLLSNSPKWTPGIQNGKAVRVKYHIPINFTQSTDPVKRVILKSSTTKGAEPLYVIDGKTASGIEMNSLNPNDISSINILKAPADILRYGEDGKNGVILISTKKEKQKETEKEQPVKQ